MSSRIVCDSESMRLASYLGMARRLVALGVRPGRATVLVSRAYCLDQRDSSWLGRAVEGEP